jgi:hypothetical protein
VAKLQQVFVFPWETGGLCQAVLKPSKLFGTAKPARSTMNVRRGGAGRAFPNSPVVLAISSQKGFLGSMKIPLSFGLS